MNAARLTADAMLEWRPKVRREPDPRQGNLFKEEAMFKTDAEFAWASAKSFEFRAIADTVPPGEHANEIVELIENVCDLIEGQIISSKSVSPDAIRAKLRLIAEFGIDAVEPLTDVIGDINTAWPIKTGADAAAS
jgi:hypothetical protein